MYDIQLSERNIVIEKSKHLGLIGVFVQQNYSQTNAPRVQASGSDSFVHSHSFRLKQNCQNATLPLCCASYYNYVPGYAAKEITVEKM